MKLQDHHLKHIKNWQASGGTQTAYCQKHGLNVKTFSRWLKNRPVLTHPSEPALIPIEIKPTITLPIAEPLRLRLSNGHSLELPSSLSPRWLAELLQCLA